MKRLKIGIVAEGPTDSLLIELLINQLLQTEHHYLELQPKQSKTGHSGDFGVYGGGWKGVRAWCQSCEGQKLKAHFLQLDLLIIHIDADVACGVRLIVPSLALPFKIPAKHWRNVL
ncbi:MAG: hypothetical protein DRR16_05040 [Candidatus Parabeggiatoa sp. nov. 3]|nr:MAG: hypothetical protein DRR00_01640 [Gammaproteobacteria bacterium]RKZ68066.1 MAG: hypothetical protein DRQ99_04780 [Gammaproteobacteria bacterium]RKZ88415.1 MAG: hypothetical protein DRR16_05040 [Gammaproteobacteria bacterium]